MKLSVRAADTPARLGGDVFCDLLIKVGSRAEVEEVAARIVADLARPFDLQAGSAKFSCSIGIALYPRHGADVEVLQRNADAARYEAKQAGRNAVRIYAERGAG